MGKRGPKKTPTKVLKLRGSVVGKNRKDVVAPSGFMVVPDKVKEDPVALEYWLSIVPDIAKMGILSTIDWSKLQELCLMWSKMQELDSAARMPVIARKKDDGKVTYEDNKFYYARLNLYREWNKLASEFCIGPTNRIGIGDLQGPVETEKSKFFEK